MYVDSIKSSNPSSEKGTSREVYSYSVLKNRNFNFAVLFSRSSKQ